MVDVTGIEFLNPVLNYLPRLSLVNPLVLVLNMTFIFVLHEVAQAFIEQNNNHDDLLMLDVYAPHQLLCVDFVRFHVGNGKEVRNISFLAFNLVLRLLLGLSFTFYNRFWNSVASVLLDIHFILIVRDNLRHLNKIFLLDFLLRCRYLYDLPIAEL